LDADGTKPQMILGGDRSITNGSPVLFRFGYATIGPLGTNHLTTNYYSGVGAGWDRNMHVNAGNVLQGDGSVQQYTTVRLRDALRNSGDSQNRIANPD
jgi:hypothetical protein